MPAKRATPIIRTGDTSVSSNVYAPPASKVESFTKQCEECGESINKKAEICPKCGVRQKQGVSKTALLLLTFFLGGLGAHKFYQRKPWWGALYLLFFWTYIPALAALIEFVIYAFTDEERLREKYPDAGGGGMVVIAVVAGFVMIMVVGILAAIALPAYQDYTMRARTAQALQAAEPLRMEVEQYIVKNQRLPTAADDVKQSFGDVPGVAVIQVVEQGVVVIRFQTESALLQDKTIELVPTLVDGRLSWTCTAGTVPAKFRPSKCR